MSSQHDPLNNALDATWRHPAALRAAGEEVTAAVELAWAAARSVFGKQAKPQHAIDLARLFIEEAKQRPRTLEVAEPTGLEDARPVPGPDAPSSAAIGTRKAKGRARPAAADPREVDLNTAPAPRTRRTAVVEEPPKANAKYGRPARM